MEDRKYLREKWKPVRIEGLKEGELYEISNYGRVRYFKKDLQEWKIYKNSLANGYEYFTWFKSNKGWRHKINKPVHRLVAECFCNKSGEEHKFVTHLNFDKRDNYYINLKWVTQEDLNRHNRKNPHVIASRFDKNGNPRSAKLTETQVIRLKKKLKRGKNPLYKIAKEFGITHTQLNRIRSGENWGHVKID